MGSLAIRARDKQGKPLAVDVEWRVSLGDETVEVDNGRQSLLQLSTEIAGLQLSAVVAPVSEVVRGVAEVQFAAAVRVNPEVLANVESGTNRFGVLIGQERLQLFIENGFCVLLSPGEELRVKLIESFALRNVFYAEDQLEIITDPSSQFGIAMHLRHPSEPLRIVFSSREAKETCLLQYLFEKAAVYRSNMVKSCFRAEQDEHLFTMRGLAEWLAQE